MGEDPHTEKPGGFGRPLARLPWTASVHGCAAVSRRLGRPLARRRSARPRARPESTLNLPLIRPSLGQLDLVRVLASAGTPIALVLVTGRPRLLHGVEALPQVKRERRARGVWDEIFDRERRRGAAAGQRGPPVLPAGPARRRRARRRAAWPLRAVRPASNLVANRRLLSPLPALAPHPTQRWPARCERRLVTRPRRGRRHAVTQQCDGSRTCGVAWPFGHGLSRPRSGRSPRSPHISRPRSGTRIPVFQREDTDSAVFARFPLHSLCPQPPRIHAVL